VGLPRLLSDIITEMIKVQPDMELVPSKAPLDMRSHLLKSEADAVMAGLVNDELPPGCEDLMWARPSTALLGIAERGGRAVLYQLRPLVTELGEVSLEGLLAATRTAARIAIG